MRIKRIVSSLLAVCLMLAALGVGAVAEGGFVFDEAGLFSAEETSALEQRLQELSETSGGTLMVITVNGEQEAAAQVYAEQLYEANAGAENGSILLIDAGAADAFISAQGTVLEAAGEHLQETADALREAVADGRYYSAAEDYVLVMERYLPAQGELLSDGGESSAPEQQEPETLVYDEAELFSAEDAAALEQKLQELNAVHNICVIVATTDDAGGKSARTYAMDFYDANVGAKNGGILLIDMDNREAFIDASGRVWEHIDGRVENILDRVVPPLSDGEYSKAAEVFVRQVERYMDTEPLPLNPEPKVPGSEPTSPGTTTTGKKAPRTEDLLQALFVGLFAGAIVFAAGFFGVKKKYSTHNTKTVYPLRERSTLELTGQEDVLVNKTRTSRIIQSSSSSGSSRSGGSRSSGGRSGGSRGGGGRKF